jgi:beta-1,4-N-acetylglucosaminyltransferase
MIFVTIGTGRFEKLVKATDELAKKLKEKIIIQKGNSICPVKNAECFAFTDEFDKYVKEARIIISHGGAGTIYGLLEKGKKIIALANLDRIDKHQKEILEKLSEEDYLIYRKDFNLKKCLEKAKKFKFKKYKKPECKIAEKIIKFLD